LQGTALSTASDIVSLLSFDMTKLKAKNFKMIKIDEQIRAKNSSVSKAFDSFV